MFKNMTVCLRLFKSKLFYLINFITLKTKKMLICIQLTESACKCEQFSTF